MIEQKIDVHGESNEELNIMDSNTEVEVIENDPALLNSEIDECKVCLGPAVDAEAKKYLIPEGPVKIDEFNLPKNICVNNQECWISSYGGYRTVCIFHCNSCDTTLV